MDEFREEVGGVEADGFGGGVVEGEVLEGYVGGVVAGEGLEEWEAMAFCAGFGGV